MHAVLSLAAFGAVAAAAGAGVHAMGDAKDAGPRETLALFEPAPAGAQPKLKARIDDRRDAEPVRRVASLTLDEPSLGIEPPGAARARPAVAMAGVAVEQGDAGAGAVRINGHTVLPGQAFSDVAAAGGLPARPEPGLWERTSTGKLPKTDEAGRTPAQAYARPFENPDGRPVVAIVVAGLGINRTHTQSAIDELPPEITLAFSAHAGGLQRWIDKARAAGHEVLIEAPMEAYEYGRARPHAHTLTTTAGTADNVARLEQLLSRATGYFGVMNDQGGKFATDAGAAGPVFDALGARGVAFVEDGGLQKSVFADAARAAGAPFAEAALRIDDDQDADAIETKLLELEALALEEGAALGAGFAFPMTIDLLNAWTERLYAKGLTLGPASAVLTASRELETGVIVRTAGEPAP